MILLRFIVGFVYACHVPRLLIDWSYTYNMQINVVWAVIQYGLWAYFSITSYMKYSEYLFKKDFKKKQIVEKLLGENEKKIPTTTTSTTKQWSWDIEDHPKFYILCLKYCPNWENIKCLTPIGLSIWVSCGLIFELFDFPPWRDMIDAHSLWH